MRRSEKWREAIKTAHHSLRVLKDICEEMEEEMKCLEDIPHNYTDIYNLDIPNAYGIIDAATCLNPGEKGDK